MLVSKLSEAIERQDEMTDIIGSSLKKIAKKIHRLELMMHNEPTEDAEAYEKKIWQDKMNKLLHYDVAKRLPTMKEIQMAKLQKEKALNNKSAAKTRKRTKHRPMFITSTDKSRKSRQTAPAGGDDGAQLTATEGTRTGSMSVPPCKGEVIGVVKNYRGLNTSCGDERTLRRLDGRFTKTSLSSSLPAWIGPGHYADALQRNGTERPDSSFQVSFRNTGRVVKKSEHHKVARFEQLSMSSSVASRELEGRPSYSASSRCSRGHDDEFAADELCCANPWSSSSAQSTIGRPASQSGRHSPQNVYIHSPKQLACAYESVISEFIRSPGDHSRSQMSIGMDDSVNLNSLDSLVLKAADVDKRRYHTADFAMGGLDLQEDIPVTSLDECGDEVGESQPPPPPARRSRASEERPTSKAQRLLTTVRRDLGRTRTSRLRNQDVSFTDSLSIIIDDWQSSENVRRAAGGEHVKRRRGRGGQEVSPDVVNLDQLLMDDTGMSFDEARMLVQEYSESMKIS